MAVTHFWNDTGLVSVLHKIYNTDVLELFSTLIELKTQQRVWISDALHLWVARIDACYSDY